MRKLFLFAFFFVVSLGSLRAQDSTARFGFGYTLGTGGGVTSGWTTHNWRAEATLGVTYTPASSYTSESATVGIGFFWLNQIENNLFLVYGPKVLVYGYKYSQTSGGYSYYLTTLLLQVGPEYLLNRHFSVGFAVSPSVSFHGNYHSDAGYSYLSGGYGPSYSLGGNISGRYFF